MKEIVLTFGDDGTVEVDSRKTGLSAKDKQRILDEIAGKLGGTISEEKHDPTQVKPTVMVQQKGA